MSQRSGGAAASNRRAVLSLRIYLPAKVLPRRGFTLIEMLVAVFILGILMALLLPAVMRSRVAARRTQCASRLHQLGLAVQSYADGHGMLPWGSSILPGFSVHTKLLPYVEQQNLYNKFDFAKPSWDPANVAMAATRVQVFLCPADSDRPPHPTMGGWTNYAANSGRGRYWFGGSEDGPFQVTIDDATDRFAVSTAGIRDGLSNTAAFSEWVTGVSNGVDPIGNIFHAAKVDPQPGNVQTFAEACRNVALESGRPKGLGWWGGPAAGPGQTMYNHFLGPNERSCYNGTQVFTGIFSASSRHGAGVNVVFFGGRVRFVSEEIDLGTWRAMGTRDEGDIVAF